MSHSKVRDEKVCLNCEAPCPGRFCANCGQENIEPKQTVWHLVNHFFSDITHFDGKFFTTVADLFRRPGFLSREYMKGRRVAYLDPIRMYIFTSAFFFLIFFSMVNLHDLETGKSFRKTIDLTAAKKKVLEGAETHEDSVNLLKAFQYTEGKSVEDLLDEAKNNDVAAKIARRSRRDSLRAVTRDSLKKFSDNLKSRDTVKNRDGLKNQDSIDKKTEELNGSGVMDEDDGDDDTIKTVAEYDSSQLAKPKTARDNWLKRVIKRRLLETNEKWHNDKAAAIREWIATFIHNFPKLLFISLPIFALLLKLLYVRRKEFYYVDHGIFAVHLYIFSFLDILVIFGTEQLKTLTGWSTFFGWLGFLVGLFAFFYYYKAMRNFYHQGRAKTLVKYFLLLFMSLFVLLILFSIFFLLSLAQS